MHEAYIGIAAKTDYKEIIFTKIYDIFSFLLSSLSKHTRVFQFHCQQKYKLNKHFF